MKDFFKGSSFKVLMIAVVVLLGFLIYTATAGSSFLASILGFVSSPMQGIATNVTENVREFTDLDGYTKDELKALVGELSGENAQLRQRLVEYESVKQENEQLKTQLEITEEVPENQLRAASVIGRDPNDVFFGFSIDKGTLSGINTGDPVITSLGLVGVVEQAYATTSKVTCLLSEDVNVTAVCILLDEDGNEAGQESGVITSNVLTASSGLLRLNYLSGDTKVKEGDIVVTSGAGGAYPADIVIGEVQSVAKAENDISMYAVVRPYEDLTSVKDVFAVVSFPGQGEDSADIPIEPDASGTEEDLE